MHSRQITQRAKKVRILLVDVDGVLTDGRVWLASLPDGTAQEIKGFSAYDGAGLKLAKMGGLKTGLITGRESAATTRRAGELDMDFVYQKRPLKLEAYEEILKRAGARDADVAFVGDDLPDLPVLKRAGLAVAVANASPETKRAAHFVTRRAGGDGAVREVVELILKAQGKWAKLIAKAEA